MVESLCIIYKDNSLLFFSFGIMKKNEWVLDRLIRLLIALLAIVWWYMRLHGTLQIVVYIVGIIALFTSITGFCALYAPFKISTYRGKQVKSWKVILWIFIALVVWWIFVFLSNFFSRKFFLEDYAKMNDSYKQLLFNSGKEKRAESISYYEKLLPAYAQFFKKYTNYKPYALKWDTQLNADLEKIAGLLNGINDGIYNGDLLATHKTLEEIRPIEQEILKRNGFSLLAIALVDFHDIMEEVIAWADEKNVQKIIETYPLADEKLKAIEIELNDEWIQTIRKNLDTTLDMAKNNQLDWLAQQWADLKASFVKVYLIKG